MRTLDIGFLAVEMAAHLRAGASYERAWQQSVRAAWEESAGKGPSGQQRRIGGGGLRWWKLLRGWEGCQEDDDVAVREGESGWAVPGVVAQYALPRSRPERGRLLHAIRAGGCEWERYLREWRMWWWARSPAGQRQRRAVEALAVACTPRRTFLMSCHWWDWALREPWGQSLYISSHPACWERLSLWWGLC